MVRHTVRGANSHKRHRIGTYKNPDGTVDGEVRKASQRERIREHPQDSVEALEHLEFPTRDKKFGYFDLNNEDIGTSSYYKDSAEWQKRFNYSALTLYPLEITDYASASTSNSLATTTATGLTGTNMDKALGSSRQYKGVTNPTTAQWHTIGGACGGNHHRHGFSTYQGITSGKGAEDQHNRTGARFMINPTTGVMKSVSDPWLVNSSIEDSQYVFQIGRHTGLTSGYKNGTGNNGWTLDEKYEVTWGANPVNTGDAYMSQPGWATDSSVDTWDGKSIDGNSKTFNQSNWRKYVVGYGHEYASELLDGIKAGTFRYSSDFVANPKWSTMSSKVYTAGGKSTVDTGIISSYASNILFAGTGVAIASGVQQSGKFKDGVLKNQDAQTHSHWDGDANDTDTATGKHGGIFLPYYNKEITAQGGLTKSIFGVKYIGDEAFAGMSIGFVAQYTGPGSTSNQMRGNFRDTQNDYYTEFVSSWSNAFGVTDGGVNGEAHVTKADGSAFVTAGLTDGTSGASISQGINRKALMNNTGQDTVMAGENFGRSWLTHSWVQYENHAEQGQNIVVVIPQTVGDQTLNYNDIIDFGTDVERVDGKGGRDEALGIATGPSDEQRDAEFARKHQLIGEDFTLMTASAADMYHPTALVVAQFVRDTAEVFDDMHITELYPNANNMSAKSTWMRNYDITFKVGLTKSDDSSGPCFPKDGDGYREGQTFTFENSKFPYKIRETGSRVEVESGLSTGFHEWEIQAMPAWDVVDGLTKDDLDDSKPSNYHGPGWLPEGTSGSDGQSEAFTFLQKAAGSGASSEPTKKRFHYVADSAKFVYKVTQSITQPFLATSTSLRGLLFADKDYVTIEDISFNLFAAGSWAVAADVPYAHFDIREHVFDHMEQDLGIPSYYWDAYSSLQLERQLITLNNFSRFDMHRKISLCWWDVLRIFDADDDIPVYIDGILQLSQDNGVRMISGNLRENDVLAISCVVRNPHPEVKDIDMRLIFQVVTTLKDRGLEMSAGLTRDGYDTVTSTLT